MESIQRQERNHNTWLTEYKGQSLKLYIRAWDYWREYTGDKDEEWIMANKYTEDWAQHIVNFRRWLKERPKLKGRGKLSDNSANAFTNGIRAYFRHIGMPLTLSKVQSDEISTVESKPRTDYPFDLRIKEQLLRVANAEEEYIVSAGVSFGLRVGDFLTITRGMLEPLMEKEVPIQLPGLVTKKKGVTAYPFIDKDAYMAIKRQLREMDLQGQTNLTNRMLTLSIQQVNDVLKKLFKKAGIPTGNYIVRFHSLRKFLTDKLASVCTEDRWKWFVGKKSSTPYVGAKGREAYKRVMEFTCINHKGTGTISDAVLEARLTRLKDEMDWIRHDNRRIGSLLEHLVKNVLNDEQQAKMRKYTKEHFGEEYPIE